jgi:hypothetical protein
MVVSKGDTNQSYGAWLKTQYLSQAPIFIPLFIPANPLS